MKKIVCSIQKLTTEKHLPSAWTDAEFRSILTMQEFEFDEASDPQEVHELAVLVLQDLGPQEAARFLLSNFAANKFSKGQIQNLSEEELRENAPWEEYADISCHALIYKMSELLFEAFPSDFCEPQLQQVIFGFESKDVAPESIAAALNPSILVQVLSRFQDSHSVLNRLFEQQLRKLGSKFPESDSIVWYWKHEPLQTMLHAHLFTSNYWIGHINDEIENVEIELPLHT
ncbi:MAG: hypothetical protein KDD62_09595 [Bdellovibrionales bacterium]|nr:hypothetical protein [Bdellovibrionales bacterium]